MPKQLEILTLNKARITDFAKERNLLLDKAAADWVLFVDTDEEITPGLRKEIEEVVNSNPEFNGYYIRRKIYFCGKYVGCDKVLRLARRAAGKWVRAVHETWKINGPTGMLNGYLIHNTAYNLHDYIEKINTYSTLHAEENQKEGKRSDLFKILIYPKLKFLENIVLGRGFVFSMMMALHSYLAWSKLWEMQRRKGG